MDTDTLSKPHYLPTVSIIDELSSDIIKSVVLFTWDNILGPKALHIWNGISNYLTIEGTADAFSSGYPASSPPSYSFTDKGQICAKQQTSNSSGQLHSSDLDGQPDKRACVAAVADGKENERSVELVYDMCSECSGKGSDSISEYSSEVSSISTSADGTLITQDLLNFSARLILNGEICKDWNSGNVDRKLVTLTDRGVVISAFTFAVGTFAGLSIHSLALFIPYEELQSYLAIQRLVASWMERLSRKLGVFLEKSPSSIAADAFTVYLDKFAVMLSSLNEAGLPNEINLSDTVFSNCDQNQDDPYSSKFLRRAISSHIMTCGHSLIVGEDPRSMNKLIATLAMFNTKPERKSSRFVVQDRLWPYHHDLCLQGVIKENSHEVNIPTEEIYCSEFPTSIIDVSTREVRQSLPCHEHNFRRYEICKQEIINLYTGKCQGLKLRTSEMFSVSDSPEELVGNLLREISFLPSEDHIVQSYIDHFMLLLQRKAVAFASYLEKETNEGRVPLKSSLKSVREQFGLTLDGDFYMVLACAEKLNCGMFAYLFGDPKEKNDEMRRIIDSF